MLPLVIAAVSSAVSALTGNSGTSPSTNALDGAGSFGNALQAAHDALHPQGQQGNSSSGTPGQGHGRGGHASNDGSNTADSHGTTPHAPSKDNAPATQHAANGAKRHNHDKTDPNQAALAAAAAAAAATLAAAANAAQAATGAAGQAANTAATQASNLANAAAALAGQANGQSTSANGTANNATQNAAATAAPAVGTPGGASALQAALSMLGQQGVVIPKLGTGTAALAPVSTAQLSGAINTAAANGASARAANIQVAPAASANTNVSASSSADATAQAAALDKAALAASSGSRDNGSASSNDSEDNAALTAETAVAQPATMPAAVQAALLTVTPPVANTPAWADAFTQKVVFLTNAHEQTAQLSLNPPDLGPLQVVLNVADKNATAMFTSSHQQVRDAVEAALPQLREALQQNGIGLGSTTVSDGSAQQQFASFAQQNGDGSGRGNGNRQGSSRHGGDADKDARVATVANVRVSNRAVDTFA